MSQVKTLSLKKAIFERSSALRSKAARIAATVRASSPSRHAARAESCPSATLDTEIDADNVVLRVRT